MSDIGAKLDQFPDAFTEKVVRASMRGAAQVGLAAIQTETPWGKGPNPPPGNMYRHLRIAKRPDKDNKITYIVFVKVGGKAQRGGGIKKVHGPSEPSGQVSPYYWFFVEFGTSRMGANPFMLRGFTKSAENAATTARDTAATKLKDVI